jgi:hypothetical protein
MGRTVAEVENVVHSGDADVFTGNAQHSRFTPLSRVINRVPKDRASAPPHVVARHCHRRFRTASIVHSFPFPGTPGKVQFARCGSFMLSKNCAHCVEDRIARQCLICVQNHGTRPQ